MSTSFPPNQGSKPPPGSPYGYGQQPAYTGPPSNASGNGGTVVMIVVAIGVVILLGLACAGAAVGFLFFARASQSMEMMEAETRAMRVDDMEAMRAEMESPPPLDASVPPEGFTPTDPQRARWSYPTSPEGASGSISQQDTSSWVETRSDNLTMRFQEVARTDEYLELYDPARQLYVRLLADHMEWKREGQEWFRGQDGKWDAPSPPPPTNTQPPQP